jgi:hypothetical protein
VFLHLLSLSLSLSLSLLSSCLSSGLTSTRGTHVGNMSHSHKNIRVVCACVAGAGNVLSASRGFVSFADLTLPLSLPRAHWVLAMDVGEHVPRAHEMMVVRNVHAHACHGVIIAWAPNWQGGAGHVNTHSAVYVQRSFEQLGYELDAGLTARLRNQTDGDDVSARNFVALRRQVRVHPC